jgi:hypothetical protein
VYKKSSINKKRQTRHNNVGRHDRQTVKEIDLQTGRETADRKTDEQT